MGDILGLDLAYNLKLTGLPAWQSSQPGQVGNQAALTVASVPGSGSSTLRVFFQMPQHTLTSGFTGRQASRQQIAAGRRFPIEHFASAKHAR